MADERLEIKPPPPAVVALRNELALPQNKEIFDAAIQGRNFEECLATIATCLGIVVDGWYDVEQLCDVLVIAMKKRSVLKVLGADGVVATSEVFSDPRLQRVQRIETESAVYLENGGDGLILPPEFKKKVQETIEPEQVSNEELAGQFPDEDPDVVETVEEIFEPKPSLH